MAEENRKMNDEFWQKIESDIGVIPKYLKNILNLSGFNNLISIRCIEENTLVEIENFVRNELSIIISHKNPSTQNINFYDYFSIYHNSPEYFKLSPGHKILLLNLKNYISEKGLGYFLKSKIQSNGSPQEKLEDQFVEPNESHNNERNMYPPIMPEDNNTRKALKRKHIDNLRTLEEETLILLTSLNNWIRNYRKKMTEHAHLMHDVSIVDVIPNQLNANLSGIITCSYCNIHIKIATDKTASGHRWIISNYMKHFKRHFEPQNSTGKDRDSCTIINSENPDELSVTDVVLKQEFLDDEYSISD